MTDCSAPSTRTRSAAAADPLHPRRDRRGGPRLRGAGAVNADLVAVGELDSLAVECAAARAEIRGRFASAVARARAWDLPKASGR